MTPDERTLLTKFFNDLNQAGNIQKDPDADAMIRQAVAANPNAAYLLVQHTIMADQALHQAQAQIAQLQASQTGTGAGVPQSGGGGFLQQPATQPAQAAAQPSAFSGGGGLGSFLRNAGTMAAGVAGGQLLFSGLSDLFGGHADAATQNPGDVPQDVTINNYNDGADGGGFDGGDGGFDSGGFDPGGF